MHFVASPVIRYGSLSFIAMAVAILLVPVDSPSLPKDLGDGPEPALCEPRTSLQLRVGSRGLPLVGSEVHLSALASKIVVREPKPDAPASCDIRYLSLGVFGETEWTIVSQPANAALTDVQPLSATLPLAREGRYRVRFTGCPNGCDVPLSGGGALPVSSASRVIDIDAVNEIPIQPETEPVLPDNLTVTEPSTFSEAEKKCQSASTVINPAWVTVDRWRGIDDYRLLEGRVVRAKISRKDSPLNHDSQDFNIDVQPDPPFEHLRTVDHNVEVEWERAHFPEAFRATRGDRVSVVGYWIHDCSHARKTEIHPPVLVAVHRPRAVEIPESEGLGENIRVPGIVTHVWVNRDAGEATGNCSLTGLHQPGGGAGFDFGPHSCVPQTEGFDSSPIQSVYDFNIYLPEDPRDVLERVAPGISAPPVPIVSTTEVTGTPAGAVLDVTVDPETGRFLRVRLDLTEYSGRTYAARIDSAWALPSPDNWDLRKWRLRIDAVDVHDDGDFGHSGEWHFLVNTNSIDQEWTVVLDKSLDDGRQTFGGLPFHTGNPNPNRTLGPDLLLFPHQRIWVHSSGFEDDVLWSDSTGQVDELEQQVADSYEQRSRCNDSGQSNCASYTLAYLIEDLGPFGRAELTPEGQRLSDAYTLRLPQAPDATRYTGPTPRAYNHPDELVLTTETPEVRLSETSFFSTQGVEPTSIGDISGETFLAGVRELQERGPERLDELMTELRDEVLSLADEAGKEDVATALRSLEDHMPASVFDEHFGDLAEQFGVGEKSGLTILLWILLVLIVVLLSILVLRRT